MESKSLIEESKDSIKETIIDTKKTFKDLGVCDELCDACAKLNFIHPSKIQVEAIPYALQGTPPLTPRT